MLKLGLYNKFGEKVGSVLKDKNFSTYYVVELYSNIVHIKLSALEFWDFATPLGLSVGSFQNLLFFKKILDKLVWRRADALLAPNFHYTTSPQICQVKNQKNFKKFCVPKLGQSFCPKFRTEHLFCPKKRTGFQCPFLRTDQKTGQKMLVQIAQKPYLNFVQFYPLQFSVNLL